MKKNNDIDRLGAVLSRGLIRAGTHDTHGTEHPGAETMASMIEGIITGDERDELLKHISSCDSCYETFLLTAELRDNAAADPEMKMDKKIRMGIDLETELEIEKETRKIIPFKPLALAASILIVVFSIYVFYRSSDIPKTPDELVLNSEKLKMPGIPESSETSEKTAGSETSEKSESLDTVGKDLSFGAKEEKPADEGVEGGGTIPAPAPVKKESTGKQEVRPGFSKISPQKLSPKKMAEPQEEVRQQRLYDQAAAKTENETDTATGVQVAAEERRDEKKAAAVGETVGGVNGMPPFQSQAVVLNVQAQQFSPNMQKQDIGKLFTESLDLSRQLVEEYDEVRREAEKTGNYNRVDSYVTGLSPLITVTTVGNTARIVPNMEWFFTMSDPRTVEYRFFALARSGWCDLADMCYEQFRERERKNRAMKGGDRFAEVDSEKVLLEQWQELNPQLDGVFKQIADRTIMNLQKSQK